MISWTRAKGKHILGIGYWGYIDLVCQYFVAFLTEFNQVQFVLTLPIYDILMVIVKCDI